LPEEGLSFTSARELFDALGNPNALERRPVLGWVATHSAEAIALGEVDGRDVVDVLIALIDRSQPYGYWQDLAIAIGAFDAPKVTAFFLGVLAGAREAVEAEDAANALERRERSGLREPLVEILLGDDADRAAAAARLLADEGDLPDRAAVRVAILEDERDPPPVGAAVTGAWVHELAGPFGAAARDRLREQGAPAAGALAEHWDELSDDDRAWLIGWAAEAAPAEAAALIARALDTGPDPLALAALRAASALPDGSIDPGILGRWAQHDEAEIRAAAIAAGAAADAELLLGDENADPELIAAAIHRLAEREGTAAIEAIAGSLESDSLEVRAAAREEIVAMGGDAIEPLRPLVRSPDPGVRAGAVRALLDLGDDEWLERELLD